MHADVVSAKYDNDDRQLATIDDISSLHQPTAEATATTDMSSS